jgi:hypothetical protein
MQVDGAAYRAEIAVPQGATVAYKFFVDGQWQLDPRNPTTVPDGLGGYNSLTVADCGPA